MVVYQNSIKILLFKELESLGYVDMDMDRDMSEDVFDRALATSECKLIQAGYTWVFNVTVDKMISGIQRLRITSDVKFRNN